MALTLLSRYPDNIEKPRARALERWHTALIELVNYLLTGTQSGEGSPEGVVTAPQGSLYRDTTSGAGATLWVKESGGTVTPTNVGWIAK